MKIVDVNILVFLVSRPSQFHPQVLSWWEAAMTGGETVGLPWISISGFLRIATNPRLLPQPLTVDEAVDRVDAWMVRPNVDLVQEAPQHWALFREFVRETGTGGNRTTDSHLAALAVARGATLVSCDTGFARFRQLRWENPAA